MLDVILEFLPEIIAVVVMATVLLARTTSNTIDDQVAKLLRDRQGQITQAVRDLLDSDPAARETIKKTAREEAAEERKQKDQG